MQKGRTKRADLSDLQGRGDVVHHWQLYLGDVVFTESQSGIGAGRNPQTIPLSGRAFV